MKLKATLFAAAATIAIAPAAQAYEGIYGAIGAGLSYMAPDRDFESGGPPFAIDSEVDYDNGVAVYLALGRSYRSNFRTEFEISYRNNDVRHIPGDGLGFSGWPTQVTGDVSTLAFMANLIKDFGDGPVTPYVGLGVGIARIDSNYIGTNAGAVGGPLNLAIDSHATNFAYQGIAGIAFDLAEGLTLDLSYRYFDTTEPSFTGTLNFNPTTYQIDYTNHTFLAGLRWNFGGSAPAVQYQDCWDGSSVPVSAECPPQLVETQDAVLDPMDITVYFDYDKHNLTPEADNLVRQAAQSALANNIDTVVVSGNTDTSGSSAYNQSLSEKRARIVSDALVRYGVPTERIEQRAFGESNLAKATSDGVREPLNRRTNVTISFE